MEMDWGKLRSFHAAAEAGSLTLAGERLGISPKTAYSHVYGAPGVSAVAILER